MLVCCLLISISVAHVTRAANVTLPLEGEKLRLPGLKLQPDDGASTENLILPQGSPRNNPKLQTAAVLHHYDVASNLSDVPQSNIVPVPNEVMLKNTKHPFPLTQAKTTKTQLKPFTFVDHLKTPGKMQGTRKNIRQKRQSFHLAPLKWHHVHIGAPLRCGENSCEKISASGDCQRDLKCLLVKYFSRWA